MEKIQFSQRYGGTWPLLAPDGSASAPPYSFGSQPGTGLSYSGGTIGVATSGVQRVIFDSSWFRPAANGGYALGRPTFGWSQLYLDYTNTGTVGAVTINKASGRVNLGAGQTQLTLTNSLITAASHIFLNADGAPGNVVAVQFFAVAGAGSATINAIPAITNQTAIDFLVINAD